MNSPTARGALPGMTSLYDDNSDLQLQAFKSFWPWLRDALQNSASLPPFSDAQSLCFADYGCSSGRNSLAHFGLVRGALQEMDALTGARAAEQLVALLNDLPSNDWNAVARAYQGQGELVPLLSPRPGPRLNDLSFYAGLVAAPDSVHVGVSTDALCWLSQPPHASVPDHLVYWGQGEEARTPVWRQAEADFERFLRFRAQEFLTGGLLLLIVPGTMDAHCCTEALLDCLYDAAKQRASRGQLDPHLLKDFVFPGYYYSAEDMEGLAVRTGQWEVLQLGAHSLTDLLDAYRASGDAAAYARALVGAMRAFSEPVVKKALALSAEGADALYATAVELVTARPDQYAFRNIQAAVLLRRLPERKKSFDDAALRSRYRRSLEMGEKFVNPPV